MKDFAKSIVCNSVTEKEFNTEADLRHWCMDHNYTYTPVGGGYYRLEDDKPGSKRPDLEAHVKAGNKVGNALKYTNLEEAKKMCQQMNDSLAPDAALRHYRHVYEKDGVYYVMETGEATAKGMKRVGNSKVGNADPRIASIKSKLPMLEKQNDVGGLKDVASFVEDSIKDLRKRLDQLEKDYNAAKNDYNDWLDLRSKVQASYQLASRK